MGAIFRVADGYFGMDFPAKTNPASQVEHGRVVLNTGRGRQRSQDDTRLAAIDHVVDGVPQTTLSLQIGERRCIWVSWAHPIIRQALISVDCHQESLTVVFVRKSAR